MIWGRLTRVEADLHLACRWRQPVRNSVIPWNSQNTCCMINGCATEWKTASQQKSQLCSSTLRAVMDHLSAVTIQWWSSKSASLKIGTWVKALTPCSTASTSNHCHDDNPDLAMKTTPYAFREFWCVAVGAFHTTLQTFCHWAGKLISIYEGLMNAKNI